MLMKKIIFISLLVIVSLLNCKSSKKTTLSDIAKPKTYYVDPNGNDNNNGNSVTSAWKSFAKINATKFYPGDKILLKSGGEWYDTLSPKGSGKEGAIITIDKYGGEAKPILHGGGKRNNSSTLLLNKVSYWEVNNLEITNTVPTGTIYAATGIKIVGGDKTGAALSNIKIKNCFVHDVNAAGAKQINYIKGSGGIILIGKLSDILIQSCHIANCSVEGLRTTGFSEMEHRSKNIIFDNNLIENIYGDGIVMAQVSDGCRVTNNTVFNACMTNDINFAGIWTVASKNTVVAHNEVFGMKGGGPNDGMAFDADGWDDLSAAESDLFEYNYSHDNNGGFFLFMSKANNITVRYNVSVNDIGTTGAKKLFLIQNSTNKDRFVYNNTFIINYPVNKLFWEGSGAQFSNNIFYVTSTIDKLCDKTPDDRTRYHNNCFYPEATFKSLEWGSAFLSKNIYLNPLFLSSNASGNGFAATNGLMIQQNSPCRNAGILISNNGGKDFWGSKLPLSNPDIGAFQYADIYSAGSSLSKF